MKVTYRKEIESIQAPLVDIVSKRVYWLKCIGHIPGTYLLKPFLSRQAFVRLPNTYFLMDIRKKGLWKNREHSTKRKER